MSTSPADDSDEPGGDDELPKDLVFLLTPAFDIYRRIEPEEFIAFAVNVDQTIDNQFRHQPEREGVEIQVACALLPGRKKLIEVQIQPPDAASAETERLTVAIDHMPPPEVTEGPVAFFRRGVFGASTQQEVGFGLPFLQFVRRPGMVLLDDVLMQAGGVPSPSRSLWGKLTGFFRTERKPVRKIAKEEIVPRLSKELGRPVIVCNGRMCVGY
jgi:hypothetical protein